MTDELQGRKAVVILSGGLDSTTCMGFALEDGYDIYPITFDYGQRHRIELDKARQVAQYYGVNKRHKVIGLPFLREFGGSALTDDSIAVPSGRVESIKPKAPGEAGLAGAERSPLAADGTEIPVTYVPGRNLLFLSIAASYAESLGSEAIYIGVNSLDYSGYPDCRPEFIQKANEVIRLATKAGVEGQPIRIRTPLLELGKSAIIREGQRMNVPYHLTTSCYNGRQLACGECESCQLRLKGFADAGLTDPIPYAANRDKP